MPRPLALQYRPRSFDDLVGQLQVQIILSKMIEKDAVPTALIFYGTRGSGKTTTARILAAALNCAADNRPCGECASCVDTFSGRSLDVIEIDAASNGLVDNIRDLRQQVQFAQTGAHRVVIFDEAQSASDAAFNALLKTLEEPPADTIFILCTTEPERIPNTVFSRCCPFLFHRLATDTIVGRLAHIAEHENRPAHRDLLELIAARADGAMRDAVMIFDQVTSIGMSTADQYRRLIGHHDHAPDIITPLAHGDLPAALIALDTALTRTADPNTLINDLSHLLRDVLVLRGGADVAVTGTALEVRQNLALLLQAPALVKAMQVLWKTRTDIRLDDLRASLELTVVMLSEVLKGHQKPAVKMTLAEMSRS